jgi:hypothetical protein
MIGAGRASLIHASAGCSKHPTGELEIMFRFMLSLVSVIAVAVIGVAQEPEAKEAIDPSGTWKWERTFGDTQIDFTLRLKLNENGKLTGNYASRRGETEREPAKIEDATIKGDKLSFQVTRARNDREFTVVYEGTVSDEAITGLTKANFGGESREFEWTAKRVVGTADVIGTWRFRIETPNGNVREPTLTISKNGKKLKGVLVSERGEREVENLAIEDNQLSFELTFERDGNSFTVAYKGTPRGDSMKGTMESEFNGESRKTAVEGKRIPKKPVDSKASQDSSES